ARRIRHWASLRRYATARSLRTRRLEQNAARTARRRAAAHGARAMAGADGDVNGARVRARLIFALLGAALLVPASPARAVVLRGHVWEATYIAAYEPTFGAARVPYAGIMKLKFNHGIISGTYVSESVRPDPLYGRTIAVSGNVSGGQILLNFSAFGGFSM